MPYEWTRTAPDDSGAVLHELRLWPHRSLPKRGFVWFIGTTAALLALPVLGVLGTAALWGLLPFAGLAVAGLWIAIQRSYRSGETWERLTLNRHEMVVQRHDPGQPPREWRANSYWVRVGLRKGPVEDYLTLTDGGREIELGAFLTPKERRGLCAELERVLGEAKE